MNLAQRVRCRASLIKLNKLYPIRNKITDKYLNKLIHFNRYKSLFLRIDALIQKHENFLLMNTSNKTGSNKV